MFWPAFLDAWPNCDDTWPWQKHLLEVLGWFGLEWPGSEFLEPDAHAFFDFLPDPVTIFRGCSRPRVRGVSWTTDKAVAEAFACGHRGIRVPDPVLAEALVPKEAVFAAFVGREESELVIDPRRARHITMKEWTQNAS